MSSRLFFNLVLQVAAVAATAVAVEEATAVVEEVRTLAGATEVVAMAVAAAATVRPRTIPASRAGSVPPSGRHPGQFMLTFGAFFFCTGGYGGGGGGYGGGGGGFGGGGGDRSVFPFSTRLHREQHG